MKNILPILGVFLIGFSAGRFAKPIPLSSAYASGVPKAPAEWKIGSTMLVTFNPIVAGTPRTDCMLEITDEKVLPAAYGWKDRAHYLKANIWTYSSNDGNYTNLIGDASFTFPGPKDAKCFMIPKKI